MFVLQSEEAATILLFYYVSIQTVICKICDIIYLSQLIHVSISLIKEMEVFYSLSQFI